jgi:hypothetical protein
MLLLTTLLLQASPLLLESYCLGRLLVAFILAVAFFSAVVLLAVSYCSHCCFCLLLASLLLLAYLLLMGISAVACGSLL